MHPVWHLHTVRFEINFRILMQTFKGRRGPPPGYLFDILTSSEPELSYRSSGIALLAAPDSRPRTRGEQGFGVRPSQKNAKFRPVKSASSIIPILQSQF